MSTRRLFIIVLDSVGVGALPDAGAFGDTGANTVLTLYKSGLLDIPNLSKMGFLRLAGIPAPAPVLGASGKLAEASLGKDTTTGHWEISGLISKRPMPVFPEGFPESVISEFRRLTGRGVLCNKPYSGTDVIRDFGREHQRTGDLIVYTSADSVFQVAAHESVVPIEQLYAYCRAARGMLTGEYAVGRVIARPFEGEYPDFRRTSRRHDFSLLPPSDTMLDVMSAAGLDTIAVGKISDIFAGKGVTESLGTNIDNSDGMRKALEVQKRDFCGLCFVNLVDFDMVFGHRNDISGYARALNRFDGELGSFLEGMREGDTLFITADHGCDPGFPGTDHTREYIPLCAVGAGVKNGADIGTRRSFADIGATALALFGLSGVAGESFLNELKGN